MACDKLPAFVPTPNSRKPKKRGENLLAILGIIIVVLIFWFVVETITKKARGHPPDPAHLEWFMSQTNQNGAQCCNEHDAFSITDSEWRIVGDSYEVHIEGEWHKILPHQKAKGPPNITGMAALWWTKQNGKVIVYCFSQGHLW